MVHISSDFYYYRVLILVYYFLLFPSCNCYITTFVNKGNNKALFRYVHSTTRTPTIAIASSSSSVDIPEVVNNKNNNKLNGLKVCIIGGGPSGLLVAHRLLNAGVSTIHLYERRSRPSSRVLEARAYALGVGIRGRTAIQSVDHQLWQSIKKRGFSSERFILHIGPFSIRLRDENDSKMNPNNDDSTGTSNSIPLEPSLLLYQSDLCAELCDELEARWKDSGRLRLYFDCKVSSIDLQKKILITDKNVEEKFDLVVGCDGVNSIVRKEIANIWTDFQSTQELLPGVFKVIQSAIMPPLLDPYAVQLLFPKSGSVTAFVEPISDGRCCILFAGSNATDILFTGGNGNRTVIEEELSIRYPKLIGIDMQSAAEQLIAQKSPSQASRVTCNTYHYSNVAVLTGDAAHATGGVSGQGVNSALQDAAVFVNILEQNYDINNKDKSLHDALLQYSQIAVPEGKALYDLSFGPKPSTFLGKLRFGIKSAKDVLFKGKFGIGELPLQTMLTLSVKSFADIRRSRDIYYDVPFPDQAYWNQSIAELDSKVKTLVA